MVVEAGDCVVVRRAVEHLPDLLEEALPIELGGADESILSQEDVLTSQSRGEAKIERMNKYIRLFGWWIVPEPSPRSLRSLARLIL